MEGKEMCKHMINEIINEVTALELIIYFSLLEIGVGEFDYAFRLLLEEPHSAFGVAVSVG